MVRVRTNEEELDLALAAELQSALLPRECPHDCPNQLAAARNRMCGSVGGDFYDFIRANEDQIVIVVGDVVGHGVRASLLMAKIMGHLRSDSELLTRPGPAVAALNRMLVELGDRTGSAMPCSIFYTVIDSPTGIGFFVNAGHPSPFLCNGDQCALLYAEQRNMLLGIEEFKPTEMCHTFTPGERMILYTDGITDAIASSGERFGERRLRETINTHTGLAPDACAKGVFDAVEHFRDGVPQTDDETIIVLDRV